MQDNVQDLLFFYAKCCDWILNILNELKAFIEGKPNCLSVHKFNLQKKSVKCILLYIQIRILVPSFSVWQCSGLLCSFCVKYCFKILFIHVYPFWNFFLTISSSLSGIFTVKWMFQVFDDVTAMKQNVNFLNVCTYQYLYSTSRPFKQYMWSTSRPFKKYM